eukprot:4135137-Karenia_brevis.AAC.1
MAFFGNKMMRNTAQFKLDLKRRTDCCNLLLKNTEIFTKRQVEWLAYNAKKLNESSVLSHAYAT